MARFEMMLDVVSFVRDERENEQELPPELARILDFDNLQLAIKAVKCGLLGYKHVGACIDYCLAQQLLQAIPYLLIFQSRRDEDVYH